eukprot:758559-Hanusia_phi.AAC.2
MYKTCTSVECTTADTGLGFVTDWTNSQSSATSTEFTIFVVLKTFQESLDANPMGLLNVGDQQNQNGLGLYKTEFKCLPEFRGKIVNGLSLSNNIVSLLAAYSPSPEIGKYNGRRLLVYDVQTQDSIPMKKVILNCKISNYRISGSLQSSISGTVSQLVLSGGNGAIPGIPQSLTIYASIIMSNGTAANFIVNGIVADNGDTALNVDSVTLITGVSAAAGSTVYIGVSPGEFYTATLEDCIGTTTTTGVNNPIFLSSTPYEVEIVRTWNKNCPQGKYEQFSTISAYYGNSADDQGDNGCFSECSRFGCDARFSYFGTLSWDLQSGINSSETILNIQSHTYDLLTISLQDQISVDDYLQIEQEIVQVTAVSTSSVTVVRGQLQTSASAHATNVVLLPVSKPNTCVKNWGSQRVLQDPDRSWRIVTIRVQGSLANVYIDGLHDGCSNADGCSLQPPVSIQNTPSALSTLRLGTIGINSADGIIKSSFANVDIAEILIYDKALTAQEMDRVGYYLSVKFGLNSFRVNRFIRSPTRTGAVLFEHGEECDQVLYKGHSSQFCEGFTDANGLYVSTNCILDGDYLTLSRYKADADTDNYYVGMRVVITAGNSNLDGTIQSAVGESCIITGYDAKLRKAACDLTDSGHSGYLLWGGAEFPCVNSGPHPTLGGQCASSSVQTDAIAASDTLITVTWAPKQFESPIYATLGDSQNLEVILINSVSVSDISYRLSVNRGMGPTSSQTFSWAILKEMQPASRLIYGRSFLVRNVSTGSTMIYVATIMDKCPDRIPDPLCPLANDRIAYLSTKLTNLFVRLSHSTSNSSFSVGSIRFATWSLLQTVDSTSTEFKIDMAQQDEILVNDYFQVDGEYVQVVAVSWSSQETNLTVVRSQLGSTATAHQTSSTLTLVLVDKRPVLVLSSTNSATSDLDASSGYLVDFAWIPQSSFVANDQYVQSVGKSEYSIEICDKFNAPFSQDAPFQVLQGENFHKKYVGIGGLDATEGFLSLGSVSKAGVVQKQNYLSIISGTANSSHFEIRGWYLMPSDLDITASYPNSFINGPKTERNSNYLHVSLASHGSDEVSLDCHVVSVPDGFCAKDYSIPCSCAMSVNCSSECSTGDCMSGPSSGLDHSWYALKKPSILCDLTEDAMSHQSLNIYWHGVKTSLTNWYRAPTPIVTSLSPSMAPYYGGISITIRGMFFGGAAIWRGRAKAKSPSVLIIGKSMIGKCDNVEYISSSQLICTLPGLALSKQMYDTTTRTIVVNVIVDTGEKRSHQDQHTKLIYTSIPAFFSCDNLMIAQNDCYDCCRNSCFGDARLQTIASTDINAVCTSNCTVYCHM